jgi:hypothetical protein
VGARNVGRAQDVHSRLAAGSGGVRPLADPSAKSLGRSVGN